MRKGSILGIRYPLWAVLIAGISLSFLLLKYLTVSVDSDPKSNFITSDTTGTINTKKVRENAGDQRKRSDDFSVLLKAIRKTNSESDGDEGAIPYVPLSDEEARELKALHEKTGPYYWELAPKILEDIITTDEFRDSGWQTSVETAAEKIFSEIDPKGTKLGKINCRSALCKISFSHEDEASYKTFMESGMDKGPWISGAGDALGGYKRGDNGEIESFIYFSKKNDTDTFLSMRIEMASRIDEMERL